MLKNRTAGVLLHITSLPSCYGTGVFGKDCTDFISHISEMGFRSWQVLPFNIADSAASPYCSPSAFAGNYVLIDPDGLVKDGLITREEADENRCDGTPYTADFAFAQEHRLHALRLAFKRMDSTLKSKVNTFEKDNEWLEDFAFFMALKASFNGNPWWEWGQMSNYNNARKYREEYDDEIDFWKFTQYIFFRQWGEIKTFAKTKGVAVIGDMPIYVAPDSVDVWSNTALFEIDKETLQPQKVAGVPPDYFSADGQLWGNPIYNWDAMEKDGYRWWISRIKHSLKMYDTVRIDHFRAFASYWEVDANAETAKDGQWKKGPGMKLFDAVREEIEEPSIIAEDLGIFGDDVAQLLKDSGFPGMRVIQFGFDPGGDSSHLPHNYPFNCVAYAGTHDNNTLLGWLWEASEDRRQFALDYCGFEGNNWGDGGYQSKSCRKIIEAVWRSPAKTAIISLQDMCGFGSDARMNIPGVPQLNWRYRTTWDVLNSIDCEYFKKINRVFKRENSMLEDVSK